LEAAVQPHIASPYEMKTVVSNDISVATTQHAKRVACKRVYYFNRDIAAEPQLMEKNLFFAYNLHTTAATSVPARHDISKFRGK
jgi:hypothetical protein